MSYTFLEIREIEGQEVAYLLDNEEGVVVRKLVMDETQNTEKSHIINSGMVPNAFAPAQKEKKTKKKYIAPPNLASVFQKPDGESGGAIEKRIV